MNVSQNTRKWSIKYMYRLFESIKVVDGRLINLKWHQQRVDRSVKKLYGDRQTFELASRLQVPEEFRAGMVKCRVSYGESLGPVTYSYYTRRTVSALQLIETQPFDYSIKYEDRSKLDQLYKLRGFCDDILITHQGMLTDTSYSNIALYDGVNWYTPETPLLAGTQRARLLSQGKLVTAPIHVDHLRDFSKLVLINAMLEFDPDQYLPIECLNRWQDSPVTF